MLTSDFKSDRDTEGKKYWDQFLNTGSVTDYLGFKQIAREEGKKEKETGPYAGQHKGKGDCTESGAYRGI